jgi:hypothetical protein
MRPVADLEEQDEYHVGQGGRRNVTASPVVRADRVI